MQDRMVGGKFVDPLLATDNLTTLGAIYLSPVVIDSLSMLNKQWNKWYKTFSK